MKFVSLMRQVLIAVGANTPGAWGGPAASIARSIAELDRRGAKIKARSRIYLTRPYGGVDQPPFLNGVVSVATRLGPVALYNLLKRLEKEAGRRRGPVNGPRPLDLDIICYYGLVIGWPVRRRSRGKLILPHPEAHRRVFVLEPLREVAPHWVHPVLGLSARQLLQRLHPDPGDIVAVS